MANSATIILRDLTTGAGRSGLTVKLRRIDDNFSSDYKTASEIGGKPGVYEFTDVPFNKYKLWVNGTEENSFGGSSGRWWPVDDLDDVFLKKDAEGHWDHQSGRVFNVSDPVSGLDVGDRDYNDARYLQIANYVNFLPPNTLLVNNLLSDIAGKVYNTIQEAVNYAASQGTWQGNWWKIFVEPHSNSDTGYNENLTFQPSIKIIGLGLVKISGSVSGFSQYTSFENIQFQHSGNITFNSSAVFKNCNFRLTGSSSVNITLNSIVGLNCGLMTTHANHGIVSVGNNNLSGWTNKEFSYQDTDKIYLSLLNISNVDIADPTPV